VRAHGPAATPVGICDKPGHIAEITLETLLLLADGGSTSMRKSILDEAREVVWLALVVGGLSVVGVGIAMALAAS
jgi:hypothetical protein